MSSQPYTNHLASETSIYLLQHAHNPVDWYPWGDEALHKAQAEDKPILVSIGYAACHWCHVMERESFEDEDTAAVMNRYFVNIKIDREERPDLDHIYMDAVQAMTGTGGWPLNVFLTPTAKPFYGGTYFPPVRAFNRMSWKETLEAVYDAFTNRREEVESQAQKLTQYIYDSSTFGLAKTDGESNAFSKHDLQTIAVNLLQSADTAWGGFGKAPKFPQTFVIQYLLRQHHFTGEQQSLRQALLSIDKMIHGGIYDQIGGGFARYSTDERWLVPHFEKMLYDNALLVNVLAEAYQSTHNDTYATVIKETLRFVRDECTSPEGGFYSAYDADSEGVEGKFYVWTKKEIESALGEDAELFCKVYDVSEKGNWEHVNIPWLPQTIKEWADTLSLGETELMEKLQRCKNILYHVRKQRVKPALDDKILLGWNALMTTACCKAYAATQENEYLQLAQKNIAFVEKSFSDGDDRWYHTWKEGRAKYPAFLDDLAFLVQAYIHLSEVTGNNQHLIHAKKFNEIIIDEFSDTESAFFWYTGKRQHDVVVRKKEVYDGAVPSGNATMAHNLLYLSVVFDIPAWRKRAEEMVQSLKEAIVRYPTSFGVWALLAQVLTEGIDEIAVTGNGALTLTRQINELYIPNKVIQTAVSPEENFPLLRSRFSAGKGDQVYLCRNYACRQPVGTIGEFKLILKN